MRSDNTLKNEVKNLEAMRDSVEVQSIKDYCTGAIDALKWIFHKKGNEQKSPSEIHAQPKA